MPDILTDGDFSTAQPVSDIRFTAPIAGVKNNYVLEQDFVQHRTDFAPLDLNTVHPTLANYYLVEETPLQPTAVANLMKWTRKYAQVPDTHYEPDAIAYNFIGYLSSEGNGRLRFSQLAPARVKCDYFLIGTGGSYATILDVPIIDEQKYYAGYPDAEALKLVTDFIQYSAEIAIPTTPSRDTYEGWIASGAEIVAAASHPSRWLGNIIKRETVYILPL